MNYIARVRNSKCVVGYISKAKDFKNISLQIKEIANQISKKSIDQIVMEYLLDLGFSTTNTGTLFLKDCIRIFLIKRKDDCKVKELFKVVVRKNVKDVYKVKNNIHNSAKVAWNTGDREHIINKLKLGPTEEISPKKVITMARYYIDID